MSTIKADICIIGAGSGGLSVASGAAQMGAKVVLVEGHKMGGDCLNYGCVPSKALLSSAHHAHAMTTGAPFGVAPAVPQVDYARAKDHVAEVIAAIEPHDSQERFEGLGVQVIRDWGSFISPTELRAGEHTITARRFVIATGSRPFVPPIDGLESVDYHTNETIFDLRERPEHLIVIGGGPIGLEMAQAHARLGCKVTVIEAQKALGKDDPDLAAFVLGKLRAEGIEIREETAAEKVTAEGGVTVHTPSGPVTGSHLLVAVGRQVNIDRLNLNVAKVDHDRAVKVDATLRSPSNRRVYAIGDAAGGLQFTHVAGYHAGIVIRSAMFGLPAKARTAHIPWVTYTDPELAQVGQTEAQAREAHGAALQVIRLSYDDTDRGRAIRAEGMLKLMVVKGRPVGASIAGPQAGELIAPWATAIANGHKLTTLANTVLPYPTLQELNKRAAGAYFSPKLFESPLVKRVVGLVQRLLP
ncbi:dihydrolipoyl dehydrogenase family protein [Vannielia litorea]|uniref:Pyruvate/2-oxoglutarate dehydrogenase complex, dihydrolipoamide dehydrogenase (E3) component n=1 Tax=Vannielia litorea TaxID=1217970 RepID=A0A1N6ICP7_9RHOB|nr:FAD-dependent oxidoreductase [Vannielia litorea]SIO29783.1 Pyruvate/2-oxoglutarate dehydrogenase complex, dihydrolipoamide dehydrogenase (E3) component [Vannielia litorea]